MVDLVSEFRAHLEAVEDRLRVFKKYEFQAEAWFKTELLTWLDAARTRGRVTRVRREVAPSPASRKKVDVAIDLDGERHWIELKHWLIGEQAGQAWNAGFYFGDDAGFGIHRDADKLVSLTTTGKLWVLVLATANPGSYEWDAGVRKYESKFGSPRIACRTDPTDFPRYYCLGLFEVERE